MVVADQVHAHQHHQDQAVDMADQVCQAVHQVYVHQHHLDQVAALTDQVVVVDLLVVAIVVVVQNQWVEEDESNENQ